MTDLANGTNHLYSPTEDPGAASTNPVARPQPGSAPMQWYRGTKPRFYRPYLIRVVNRTDTMMEFVFLHARTGADLKLSKPTFEIAYHDGRYAYSALPSTAPKARPGTAQSCGLLFMSDLYIQELPEADRAALRGTGNGEGKYPYSAGQYAELVTRLHAEVGGRLSAEDEADVASLLELLKSVA
ncbi:MAG TPA: hypothetical protein VNO30_02205 [Kofleriaceae bacterium]|nr:hypothetical protein [Kofleriaceae bacterium]